MDTSTDTLRNYIQAQRDAGVSDDAIANALVSAGWQQSMIDQVLTVNGDAPYQQPQVKPLNSPPVTVESLVESPRSNDVQPDVNEPSFKNIKKVKLIAKITIALGILQVIAAFIQDINVLSIIFGVAQIAIGFGVFKLKRIAYTFFNVMCILSIIASILLLPVLFFGVLLLMFLSSFLELISGIFIVLLLVSTPAFYIYAGIVFHKKDIRQVFHKTANLK